MAEQINSIPTGPIAYLTGEYPRATDTFIQREVAALRDLGIAVTTCSIRQTDQDHHVGIEQRREAGTTFYVLRAARSPLHLLGCHAKAVLSEPRRYFQTLALAWRTKAPGVRGSLFQLFYFAEAVVLANHLKSREIIHLHNHIAKASGTVAMLCSHMSGIPYSFTLHGPDIFFEPHQWRLDEKIARAKFVACISNFARSQAMVFSDQRFWSKLHIVHCGIDPSLYEKPKMDRRKSTDQNLLFVGRLAAVKGLSVLFKSAVELRRDFSALKITLVGDGPERMNLENEVQQLGLEDCVEFVGYQSQSEVAEFLQAADLLILPSFAEGLPVVLMEAMAAQVPVVTTPVGGVTELVEDGINGALVPPGDEVTLTRRISELMRDRNLRKKMGQAGRKKVIESFTVDAEAAWLAQLMASYLGDHTHRVALSRDDVSRSNQGKPSP